MVAPVWRACSRNHLSRSGIASHCILPGACMNQRSEFAVDEELRCLKLINDTGALIASELNLEKLVKAVVDAGVSIVGAEFGAFFYNTTGREGEALVPYALSGAEHDAFSGFPHPRATAVFAPTFHGEGIIRSPDITKDPRYGLSGPYHGMPAGHLPVRSYLAVPVISRSGEVVGGLFFGHAEPDRFGPDHERVIGGIANHAATALDNSRLYSEARNEIRLRELAELSLRDSDRRLNAVLDNATVAVFLMNDRQRCVYMNAAAEQLTGYTLAETEGRVLHDVIHHTRPDGSHFPLEECPIDRAFPQGRQEQGEDIFVHKTGSFYPVAFTASPVHDEANEVVGTVIEVRDISEEKRSQEARSLLMREVDHRARNALAVVQSLVHLTQGKDLEDYKAILMGRVSALARAQTSLTHQQWEGADLRELVEAEVGGLCPKDFFCFSGPCIQLLPEHVQPMGMILHELATNATKHGACSVPSGAIRVEWLRQGRGLKLLWCESGGPPVSEPHRKGFGSRLIVDLSRQMGATVEKRWEPGGLIVEIDLPRIASPGR